MNVARIAVLGVAVVTAGLSAFLVRSMMSDDDRSAEASQATAALNTTRVLVANRNIGLGETLRSDDLRWMDWPEGDITSVFISEKKSPDAKSRWSGSVVRFPIVAGEPIIGAKLVTEATGSVMSAILGAGMRAISIEISAETGAGGFILPNDRVDVIVTYKEVTEVDRRREENMESLTVMHNVRVMAIDQTFRDEDGQQVVVGRTATLEMPVEFAEQLALAEAMGDLSLALRSIETIDGAANDMTPRLAEEFSEDGGKAKMNTVTVLRFGHRTSEGGGS